MWVWYAQYENICEYGMHSIRMYVWVWYAQYENVYGYGIYSMKIYVDKIYTV